MPDMRSFLTVVFYPVRQLFTARADLMLEDLASRQQPAVLAAKKPTALRARVCRFGKALRRAMHVSRHTTAGPDRGGLSGEEPH